jgi:predicted nucleic acid-binding protein
MERLFVDTSAWYSFANSKAPKHQEVVDALTSWDGRLVTTEYVFDELVTLIRYRVGHAQAVAVGDTLRDGKTCLLVSVEPQDFERAWEQFAGQADQRLSFTDCTSFAVMRRLKLNTAAALDEDFAVAGFTVLPRKDHP